MSIFDVRATYKPFQYPWCFEAHVAQNQAHWVPTVVPMARDVDDYDRLSPSERHIVTQVLKFFTQSELDVANNYMDHLLGHFKLPEVRMMLSTFSAFEGLHAWAYAYLSDSLNLDRDPTFYSKFTEIKAMKEKHDFLTETRSDDLQGLATRLAIFGGGVEGVQLFSAFAILNSFPWRNKMLGMGQIITWSIRDESLHAASITKLFRTIVEENPRIWDDTLKRAIYSAFERIVSLEEAFVDSTFELGDVPQLKAADVKTYVRFMADVRLGDLGLKPIFGAKTHPLGWLDTMINATEHAAFFETRSTSYAKGLIREDLPRAITTIERKGATK